MVYFNRVLLSSPFFFLFCLLPEPAGCCLSSVNACKRPDRERRNAEHKKGGIVQFRGFHSCSSPVLLFLQVPAGFPGHHVIYVLHFAINAF